MEVNMPHKSLNDATNHPGNSNGQPMGMGLRQNYLRLPELIAQSIGLVGVSGGIGILIPAVFATAGNGTWLAYVFATIALLFSSWSISLFARKMPSPGALYTYASIGIGPTWGIICGWSLLIAYAVGAAGILQGTVDTFLLVFRKIGILSAVGSPSLTATLTLFIAGAALYIAYRDIRLSTRFSLFVELSTILLIVVVVTLTIMNGNHAVDRSQLRLEGVQVDQLRLGMVLAFFSFVGFESATVLGAEAKAPHKAIPRAVIISIVGPAILFIFAGYGLVGAFQGASPALNEVEGPISILAGRVKLGSLSLFIEIGVALSFFAAFFSSINAGARIMYVFARQGLLQSASGRTHALNATPHVAVVLLTVLAVATDLLFTMNDVPLQVSYGYLSTIATYGYLFAYILVAVGAPLYLRRQGQLKGLQLAASCITVVLLSIPLLGSIYPSPQGIYAWLPYVFIALISLGLLWYFLLKAFAPARLNSLKMDVA